MSRWTEKARDLRRWPTHCVIVMFGLLLSGQLRADIQANGEMLTVDTSTLTAVFRGGDLIQLTNKSTGESYTRPPSTSALLDVQLMQPTGGPLPTADWTVSPGTATAAFSGGARSATLTVSIDNQTGEIVVNVSGHSQEAGVTGVVWGIAGVDLSSGRLVLPSQGGNYVDLAHLQNVTIQYPTSWAAQLVMFEGRQGGFIAYSTDTGFQWKDLIIAAGGNSTANLQLKTEAPGPWPSAFSTAPMEWRVNVFAGDWRQGASIYKSWMQSQWPPSPPTGARSWAKTTQAVISLDQLPDNEYLSTLARLVDAQKTVLYLIDWRKDPPGQNFPDYTPAPRLKSLVDYAHQLGFRILLHIDSMGVDPRNPDYASVRQYQFRYPDTLSLYGWLWTSPLSTQQRFAYIDPASSAWRKLLLSRMDVAIQAVHPDAIHLDSVPGMLNDGNGLIDGMNSVQGLIALQRELVETYPNIVFDTEGLAEPSVPYDWLAQRWNGWYSYLPSHPLSTFLLTDNVHLYGHLDQPNPGEPGFLSWMKQYEAQGVLPLLHVDAVPRAAEPSFARTFALIQYFQQNDLKPDWTGDWKSALFRYRGANGATAVLTDSGTLITLLGAQKTLYQRVHGTTTIQTALFIDGWPAFDSTTLYGLDPAAEYWLDQLPRPSGTMHVNALPPNVILGENTRIDNSTASISLLDANRTHFDFFAGLQTAATGVDANGQTGPPAGTMVTQLSAGGDVRQAIFEHPPAPGAESFIDFTIPMPAVSGVVLQFAAAISDQSPRTDPVTLRITVDGAEVWRQDVVKGAWVPGLVDLSPYGGRIVHLRLLTNVNASHDNAYAWAAWSSFAFIENSQQGLISLDITLPPNSQVSMLSGGGQMQVVQGKAAVQSVPVPGYLLLSLKPDNPATAVQNLMNTPFPLYYAEPGQLPVAAYVIYNQHPTVGSASSNGATRSPVLILHAANYGRTVASWRLQLPKNAPLQFSFSAGLQDGSPNPAGETLAVAVNGSILWQYRTSAFGWKDGSIDLSAFQGQNIFLELIADSGNTGFYVAALWAGLQLVSSPVTSTVTLTPSSASMAASGGAGSISVVVTPQTASWHAASNAGWIEITSNSGGLGNGTVFYLVAANPTSRERTGTLTIGTQTFTLVQAGVSEQNPVIRSVGTASGGPDLAPNDWIVIKGTNLVPADTPASGVIWSNAMEFASGRMPIQLNGVSVMVNGKPAYIYFFCSGATSAICALDQINVLTPLDSTIGPAEIVVNNGTTASAPFPVYRRPVSPALLQYGTNGYVVGTHADFSLVGPTSLYPGSSTPAHPGETIIFYGVGFGLPATPLTEGSSTQSGILSSGLACQIAGIASPVSFAGLISPGLYQLNMTVPTTGTADGDNLVTCTYNGVPTQPGSLVSVQN